MNTRDYCHIFIGYSLMYTFGSLTNFAEFNTYSKIVGVPLISITTGIAGGFAWEWLQSLVNPKNFDKNDIFRTAVGTLSGGLFSLWCPDVNLLMIPLCAISIGLVLRDLIK